MHNKLYIIGNGFDLEHKLPTSFDTDFKKIAIHNEIDKSFWDLYQTENVSIWSDFENLLGRPDFNSLEEIFRGYEPNFYSEYEHDRDAIIYIAQSSGNLNKSLYEFAIKADEDIKNHNSLEKYKHLFGKKDIFINFNYTHSLEVLYGIDRNNILHIHGEVGKDNLILGYPEGKFKPERYEYDPTQKGKGHFIKIDINDFIKFAEEDELLDSYSSRALECLIEKTESFSKAFQKKAISSFLKDKRVDNIVVIGHSCKIDFDYFEYIVSKYPNAQWEFNPYSNDDYNNVKAIVQMLKIRRFIIKNNN